MTPDIKYSLYNDSPEIEATRLRSILLFNGKVKKSRRQDMITKTILSLILAHDGDATKEGILKELNTQFKLDYNQKELDAQIKKLYKLGLIEKEEDPLVVKDSEKGRNFFEELDHNTEILLNGILEKAEILYAPSMINNPDPLKKTVRRALSVFYSMNGYAFFNVQKKEEISIKDAAIDLVKSEISDKRLAECVIRALAEVIEKPNEEQLNILTQWARAFVAMESMSLDPLLNNFKSKNLKEKEFIVDTDIVLYCLTSKARYSDNYIKMITKLKELGCKMYLVPEVINEVQKHIDAAKKCYKFYGSQLLGFPDDMLYEKISNVFIDDYVHEERDANDKTPFNFYIDEFSDPEYPALLHTKIVKAFSENALNDVLEVDTVSEDFLQLQSEIYKLTMQTPKAQNRIEEDNRAISYLDAFLYMAALKNNSDLDISKMLSGKTYILTDSTRAIKAANNLGWVRNDVVCHPNALMALLMEMGDIKNQETIINLFDNPFLAYVADNIWNEIDPLLKEGACIKHKGFDRLRADVDKSFDKLITEDVSTEERHAMLRSYDIYLPDMVDVAEKREQEQRLENEKMKKEVEDLKKYLSKARGAKGKAAKRISTIYDLNKKRK